jgi:antitoxin MazE
MKARVQKWGKSLAIRIPETLATEVGLDEGAEVDLYYAGGRIVIARRTRSRKRKYSLKEMLRSIRPDHLHGEIDFGPPVGKEIW